MTRKTHPQKQSWTAIPPWAVAGAVVILVAVVAVMARQNILHQQRARLKLLEEKGAALIRAFEAGTRTGMMEMRWGRVQLQILLQETARQPDIRYLLVVDRQGEVLFHSDPRQVGTHHGTGLGLARVVESTALNTRRRPDDGTGTGDAVFEVYRKFQPLEGPPGRGRGRHRLSRRRMMSGSADGRWRPPDHAPDEQHFWQSQDKGWIIFVGLDLTPVEAANRADTRQTLVVSLVMLLAGGAGLLLLLMGQQVAATRSSLNRIKAFSDTLVSHMPMGLLAVDENDRIRTCNPAGGRILDRSPSKLTGRPVADTLPEGVWPRIAATGQRAAELPIEVEGRLPDGRPLPLEVVLSRLIDDEGHYQGAVVLFRDVSELRALRKTVARSQRLAAVGRLAAGVAHEIRNPLSSIKGFATHFRQRYREVPEDQAIADLMIQEVDRLNRVVTQMIDFARPAAPARREVAVNALIQEALTLVESRADTRRHQVFFHPARPEPRLQADPDQIRQVLLNLLINAIEAMETDGVLTVSIQAGERPAPGVLIHVKDTGPGIEAQALSRVFDPYYSTKPSGTGLGLAIVHNIVEAHQGKVTVDSRPGEGTTVTVFLPEQPPAGGSESQEVME